MARLTEEPWFRPGDITPADLNTGDAKQLDALELTEEEWMKERRKLRERLARKKPVGFLPWEGRE